MEQKFLPEKKMDRERGECYGKGNPHVALLKYIKFPCWLPNRSALILYKNVKRHLSPGNRSKVSQTVTL